MPTDKRLLSAYLQSNLKIQVKLESLKQNPQTRGKNLG